MTIHDPGTEGVTDREVLEALYHATGGPDWTNRTNWLSNMPLSEWYGVTTDGRRAGHGAESLWQRTERDAPTRTGPTGSAPRLHLQINELRGGIPAELAGLTNLLELDLGVNRLSGERSRWS